MRSNVLDMSRLNACVVIPLSKDVHKSLQMHVNWFTVESPGINPDCDCVIILLYCRKLYTCLWINFSSTMPVQLNKEMGR